MKGRRVWVPVGGAPRLGTVVRATYAPKTGARVLAVELDEPVDGTETVVVNPSVDDVLFEEEL
jgi:hypothetical protein